MLPTWVRVLVSQAASVARARKPAAIPTTKPSRIWTPNGQRAGLSVRLRELGADKETISKAIRGI
ncbi:hypothetical protein GCM10023319_51920 [Nocardia iowensis]